LAITEIVDTYEATADREQLSNIIYNLSPKNLGHIKVI